MTSELTCYGVSPCVECAACAKRDAALREMDAKRQRNAEAVQRIGYELDAARGEVERLRAQLDAAREAWGNRSDLSWHSAFVEGVKALRPEHAAQMDAALGGDA